MYIGGIDFPLILFSGILNSNFSRIPLSSLFKTEARFSGVDSCFIKFGFTHEYRRNLFFFSI